jgi:hypothetical protein
VKLAAILSGVEGVWVPVLSEVEGRVSGKMIFIPEYLHSIYTSLDLLKNKLIGQTLLSPFYTFLSPGYQGRFFMEQKGETMDSWQNEFSFYAGFGFKKSMDALRQPGRI